MIICEQLLGSYFCLLFAVIMLHIFDAQCRRKKIRLFYIRKLHINYTAMLPLIFSPPNKTVNATKFPPNSWPQHRKTGPTPKNFHSKIGMNRDQNTYFFYRR